MCPAAGVLRASGYEQTEGQELPDPVTLTCEMATTGSRAQKLSGEKRSDCIDGAWLNDPSIVC